MPLVLWWWHLVVMLHGGDNPQFAYGLVIVTVLVLATVLSVLVVLAYDIYEWWTDR